MRDIFENVSAKCEECKTHIDGRYRRGTKYYCAEHYQKTSTEEIRATKKMEKEIDEYKWLKPI